MFRPLRPPAHSGDARVNGPLIHPSILNLVYSPETRDPVKQVLCLARSGPLTN